MGERAKIILNEYSAKSLLMRDTLDLDKFYTADLKLFVEVAKKEIERLNNIINEFDNWLEEQLGYFISNNKEGGFSTNVEDLEIVKEKLQELKGSDKE